MAESRESHALQAPTTNRRAKIAAWLGLVIAMALIFTGYYDLCDMQMTGFLHDDGVYALTAKALATGQGYKLLNLPLPGGPDFMWQVKYPIGYPLLLSLGWLIEPNFPANLPWLHGLTVLCAVLAIFALYGYLRSARQLSNALSGLIGLLVATNFQYMYYATALMSEAPYLLCSLLALWLAETGDDPPSRKHMAAMVVASAAAFHVRTVGLSLIAAIFLGLAIRKHWKSAAIFAASSAMLTVIPWGLWITAHGLKLTSLNYPLAYVYGGYGIEAAVNAPPGGLTAYAAAILTQGVLPLINSLPDLLLPQVSLWLSPFAGANTLLALGLAGAIIALAIQDVRHRRGDISALYLLLSLGVVSVWMYPNQAIRFLLVLLPWLWLYTLRAGWFLLRAGLAGLPGSVQGLVSRYSRWPWLRWALGGLLGLFLLWPGVPGYQLLSRMRGQHLVDVTAKTAPLWQDYQAAFQAIQTHTRPTERIAGIWDPIFYLYAGRPTFVLFTSSLQNFNGQATDESYRRLRASLIRYQVKYIVVEPFILNQVFQRTENPVATGLLQRFPQEFAPVYQSPHHLLRIYRFIPNGSAQHTPAMAGRKE